MDINIYGQIILAALLINFLIESTAQWLNIKAFVPQLPEEFAEFYSATEYKKSQEYTLVRTKFGLLTSSFDLLLLLFFWLSGGFNYLDIVVRDFGFGPVLTGLIYIGCIMLLKTILGLPFSVYSTFVIEERFGFNRTTPRTFFFDLLKGILLSVVLGGVLLGSILFLFGWAGPRAWLYCWAVVTVIILVVQFVAPTWIMPLFNKFAPLEDGELRDQIMAYAKSVDFSLENLFVMDGSKRSSKSNAFFTGFGKHKRIALFDTLIEKHSVSELVAILAHEIGHYKKKHILQGMFIGILHMGVMLFLLSLFTANQGLHDAFFMEHQSVYCGLIFFGMLLTPVELILSVLMNMLSRKNEYEADRFAVTTFGSKSAMISALQKLSAHNLSNLTPHPLMVFLHYSHPPLLNRVRAIKDL